MFFILSKTIYFLAMPLPLIIIIGVASFFFKRKKIKNGLRIVSFGMLIFFTNPYIANKAISAWEGDPTPIASIGQYDTGIVLTGITNRHKSPHDRVYFARGADRIFHALQLYRQGKVKQILISGGSGKLINNSDDLKEADELAQVLKIANVPDSVIIIENESKNTYESAVNVKNLLKGEDQKLLLFTSAFHMKRSMLCFEKQGISIDAFPADFHGQESNLTLDSTLIPKPSALKSWSILSKEMSGIVMYWLMGYI